MIPGVATQKRSKGSKIEKEQSGSANLIRSSGSFSEIEADRSLPEFCGLQSFSILRPNGSFRSSSIFPNLGSRSKRSGQDQTSHKLIEQDRSLPNSWLRSALISKKNQIRSVDPLSSFSIFDPFDLFRVTKPGMIWSL